MLKFYDVGDGEMVIAADASDLVEQLRRTSKVPVDTAAAYRERAAFWGTELNGMAIRTTSDEEFLEDMLATGYFKEVVQERPQ